MGGRPIFALNIVGFPVGLPKDILVSVLRGGADKAGEAGVLIVGGHTVDDDEPKYGLAVTGVVKPGEQITCKGARVGDALILTKPIGTGVITTAGKQQRVEQDVLDDAVEVMSALNAEASRVMIDVGVNACTDITGFGLLGHLRTVLEPSRVAAVVHYEAVPLLRGAWVLAAQGITPGGTGRNVDSVADVTAWPDGLDEAWTTLLCDAQTSGGLLISVSPDKRRTAAHRSHRRRGGSRHDCRGGRSSRFPGRQAHRRPTLVAHSIHASSLCQPPGHGCVGLHRARRACLWVHRAGRRYLRTGGERRVSPSRGVCAYTHALRSFRRRASRGACSASRGHQGRSSSGAAESLRQCSAATWATLPALGPRLSPRRVLHRRLSLSGPRLPCPPLSKPRLL